MFIIPARRVGGGLQDISRDQMQHNAAMNTQMTERFNVAGAVLVKLFGSLDREKRAVRHSERNAVRDAGVRAAMLGRVFFVALGLVAALGTAAIYGIGAQLVVERRHHAPARWSRSRRSSPASTNRSPGSPTLAST